jgi:hypothetical protein
MEANGASTPSGVVLADPDHLVHAVLVHGPDEYSARCGAGPVFLVPGQFDAAAPDACPGCGRARG